MNAQSLLLADTSTKSPSPTPPGKDAFDLSDNEDYHVAAPLEINGDDLSSPCRCLTSEELPFDRVPSPGGRKGDNESETWDLLLRYPPEEEMGKYKGKLGKPGQFLRPSTWGTYCGKHDEFVSPLCATDEAMNVESKSWCRQSWCFVSAACACGDAATDSSAEMTLRHAIRIPTQMLNEESRDGAHGTVYQSYQNCDAEEIAEIGTVEDDLCRREPEKCKEAQAFCFEDASRNKGHRARNEDASTINVDIDIPSTLNSQPIRLKLNGANVFSMGAKETTVPVTVSS